MNEVAELRRALARERELRSAAEESSFIADADEVTGAPMCGRVALHGREEKKPVDNSGAILLSFSFSFSFWGFRFTDSRRCWSKRGAIANRPKASWKPPQQRCLPLPLYPLRVWCADGRDFLFFCAVLQRAADRGAARHRMASRDQRHPGTHSTLDTLVWPRRVTKIMPVVDLRQDTSAAVETDRNELRERLRQLENGLKNEDSSLRERVNQLEATQGHLAVQHGMEVHDIDLRMKVLIPTRYEPHPPTHHLRAPEST